MISTGGCRQTEEGGEYQSRRRGPCNGTRIHPVLARRDNVRIRIPTWCQDHVDPPAIIGKSAYRKRDTRLLWRVNQTAYWRRRDMYIPGTVLHVGRGSPSGRRIYRSCLDQLPSLERRKFDLQVEIIDTYPLPINSGRLEEIEKEGTVRFIWMDGGSACREVITRG